jgi:hypothetical protein
MNKTRLGTRKNVESMVFLPCLSEKMRAAGATNVALAEVSGVSARTINWARQGDPCRRDLGIAIYGALNTKKFQRSPCGAK